MRNNTLKAVKYAAAQNQSRVGLGTRTIPNKKKAVKPFRYKGELNG